MRVPFLLTCWLVGANVLMRTFTNELNVAPKILNLVDLPLVGLICLVSACYPRVERLPSWVSTVMRRTLWFCLVCISGAFLNLDYFAILPAASQFIMLLTPLALFVFLERLHLNQNDILSFSKFLKGLILLEFAIGVAQIPVRIATGDSEAIHGTFTGNAEHYAAFMMVGSFYYAGLCVNSPRNRSRYIALIVGILVMVLSIDNKASWFGVAVSLVAVLLQLGVSQGFIKRLAIAIPLGALTVFFIAYLAGKTTATLYKFERLATGVQNGEMLNLGKVKAYMDIAKSHFTHPHMLFVGAGLSNFYSRGCRQFYFSETARARMYANPEFLKKDRESNAPVRASDALGNLISVSVHDPYYSQFYGDTDQIYAVGSHQVDSPYSPYAGLLGETGLIGTFLYMSIYLIALVRLHNWVPIFRSRGDILPLMVATYGFLIYLLANSIYGPFLETTRLTTILWSMVALVCIYVRNCELDQEGLLESSCSPISRLDRSRKPFLSPPVP